MGWSVFSELTRVCVYTMLVTAPANEHRRSQEPAEIQPGREAACTNYLRESTFLKASFC